ncbi:MAG TPA: acyltransferase [Burkholderiaceae bacterium]|nr:acyltransferase [Burkholderiaceae bacterium]
MSPVSLLPLPLLLGLAFLVVYLLDRCFPVHLKEGRASTIDGLRGYLAFAVFLHHATIWYFFLRSGVWQDSPSRLHVHLGQTSVSLFFMVTGYLFFGKLLETKARPVDWLRLYVSRGLRILPVFVLLSVVAAALIVAIKGLGLDVGNPVLLAHTARKLYVTAGVTWTLKYEWNFYFTLPVLALVLTRRVPWPWLVVSVLYLARESLDGLLNIYALAFVGGMAAAVSSRWGWVQVWSRTRAASALVLSLIVGVVAGFEGAYQPLPLAMLGLAFVQIANGTDVFGLLSARLSRVFGEITYSLYLLHGLLLFLCFRFVVGLANAAALDAVQHWLVIAGLTPVVVAVAFFSFRWIESPAIEQTERVTAWLRSRVLRRSTAS